jgi:ribosomal protein S18 acetylase RimI-like enzyme
MTSESLALRPEIVSASNLSIDSQTLQLPLNPINSSLAIKDFNEAHMGQMTAIMDALRLKGAFTPEDLLLASNCIKEKLENRQGYEVKVAELNGLVIGFICYSKVPASESSYELCWLAVHPAMQGNGLGKSLLAEAENDIKVKGGKTIILDTTSKEGYSAARHLYEKSGYRLVSKIDRLYNEKEDHLTYRKDL